MEYVILVLLVLICGACIYFGMTLNALKSLNETNKKLVQESVQLQQRVVQLEEENNDYSTVMNLYDTFMENIYSVMNEDVEFLRGTLAQKLSLDIPEVREMFVGLTKFSDDLTRIREAIQEIQTTKNE